MFKLISALLAALFLLLSCTGACAETILWEDETGQLILGDDGELEFIAPDLVETEEEQYTIIEETFTPAPSGTPSSYEDVMAQMAQKYGLHTPVAPTPSPEPQPFSFSRTLSYGDSGELVSRLQSRLLELGFYNARVSGGYYKITRSAVRDFQTHNGLVSDGVAGRQTQELLFSSDALPASAAPLPTPTLKPTQYKLMVDVANQITRAYTYDENGEYTVLVREMICSTGTKKYATPLGTTIMPKSVPAGAISPRGIPTHSISPASTAPMRSTLCSTMRQTKHYSRFNPLKHLAPQHRTAASGSMFLTPNGFTITAPREPSSPSTKASMIPNTP